MRTLASLLAAALLSPASPAFAQESTVEQLEARIDALEREAAVLRAQIQQVRRVQAVATPARPDRQAVAAASDERHMGGDAQSWNGAYVGIHGGYARFRSRFTDAAGVNPDAQATSGFAFGAQLGHRWQSGGLVVGVELEADFPLVPDHDRPLVGAPSNIPVFQLDQRWSGRVKANLGIAAGSFLAYGHAGLDVTRLRLDVEGVICSSTQCSFLGQTRTDQRTFAGSILGVGAAFRLGDDLSLGIEATRSDFGRTYSGSNNYDVADHAVLLRLNRELR